MVGGASARRGRAQNISNLLAFEMIKDQGESAQGTHLALNDPNKFSFLLQSKRHGLVLTVLHVYFQSQMACNNSS